MSTTNKTVLGIVVLVVVVLIAAYALRAHTPSSTAPVSGTDSASLPTSASDTSDAALQKDSAAVDTQLQGLTSDTETVNQGVSESQL